MVRLRKCARATVWLSAMLFPFALGAATQSVRFVVHVPGGTPQNAVVYISGSTTQLGVWRPDGLKLNRRDDGAYVTLVQLPAKQTIEFKLTRGSWASVEKNADGSDRANRTAEITPETREIEATVERWGSESTPSPRPKTVVGTLKMHDLDSRSLKQKRTVRVWLPPAYETDKAARFDVLYLHDGQNCFDRATSAFGNEWEIDETLTRLIGERRIRPIIVVAIDNGLANRINELTYTADAKRGGGQGDSYTNFLVSEVKPFIERTYRTITGPAHTFLGGSSLGGIASLEIARRHPETFGGIIAMSPALWWADEALTRDIERDPGRLRNTRVWLDMGAKEGGIVVAASAGDESKLSEPGPRAEKEDPNNRLVTAARRLAAALTKHAIVHRLTIDADHPLHNEPAWAARFPAAIEFLLNNER